MKKRFVASFFSILMFFTFFAFSSALAAENGDGNEILVSGDFEYEILYDNEINIVSYKGSASTVNIPSTLDGYKVVEISSECFSGNTRLSSIVIPNTISYIDMGSFEGCTSLKNVTIPSSVDEIKFNAFGDCISLETIVIPSGVKSIDGSVFCGCTSLKNISIPTSVTSIGSYAFEGCTSLVTLTIPGSIKTIESNLFSGCTLLKNVSIPTSVTSIGPGVFKDCTSLEAMTIPSGVKTIKDEMFSGCTALKKVSVPGTVTTIGNSAFMNCELLNDIRIPDSVIQVGGYAFARCISLENIDFIKNLSIINDSTFNQCTSLTSLTIPGNIKTLDESAFQSCLGLTDVMISDGVNVIGKSAFFGCNNLTSVQIAESVESIGENAFSNCISLEKITIPSKVTLINKNTFSGCESLESVTINGSIQTIDEKAFLNCYMLKSINFPTGLSEIKSRAFENASLSDVIFPNTLKKICYGAFKNCKFEVLNLPNGLETIDSDAFIECIFLTQVNISSSVKSLGKGVFVKCGSVLSYNVDPDNTEFKDVDGVMFSKDASKLLLYPVAKSAKKVVVPDGVVTIGESAFRDVKNVEEIILPMSLTTIEQWGLDTSSPVFKKVVIPNSVTNFSKYAFNYYYDEQPLTAYIDKSTIIEDYCKSMKIPYLYLTSNLELNPNNKKINENESFLIEALITPDDAGDKSIDWTSSDSSVASVDENGNVTGVSKGNAVITASSKDGSGFSASCNVEVVKPVTKIQFDSSTKQIYDGRSIKINVTVSPVDATNTELAWSSSDDSVAIVDEFGNVTGIKKGTSIITATAKDGSGVNAKCTVTVLKSVTKIQLSETSKEILEGKTFKLNTTIIPSDADYKYLNWSSNNTSIATVDSSGNVKGVKKGSAVITASARDGSGVNAKCTVIVKKPVTNIELNFTNKEILLGNSFTLKSTVLPSDADNKEVDITSSDNLSIDDNGVVKALSEGRGSITVTAMDGSSVSARCDVKVIALASSIELNETSKDLFVGDTFKLNATVLPEYTTDKSIHWGSTNTKAVSVDQEGNITGVGEGTSVITAMSKDGSGVSAVCKVGVKYFVQVKEIKFDYNEKNIALDQKYKIEPIILPKNASIKNLKWGSTNSNVATIDENGIITPIIEGTTVITATALDGSDVSGVCTINVVPPVKVSKIILSDKDISVVESKSVKLSAKVVPDNATTKDINWSSSNEEIAAVDINGNVKGLKSGNAIITAEAKDGSGIKEECNVNVTPFIKISKITLSETKKSITQSKTFKLSAKVYPDNATDKEITWESSNNTIATVDKSGNVKGVKAGSTVISAKAKDGSGVSEKCTVSVIKPIIKVSKVKLNYTSKTLAVGYSISLKSSITPSNASNKYVTYTTSNKKVVTVSSGGKVYAKYPGKAYIYARAKDGSGKYARVTVTVVPNKVSKLKLKSGKKKATINISKTSGAKNYEIYRSTKKNKGFKKIKTTSSIKYVNKKLKSKKTYYYKVKAVNGKYKGSFSKVYKVKIK